MKKIGLEHINNICGITFSYTFTSSYILAWMVVCIRPCLVIATLLTSVNIEHCGTSQSKLWKSYTSYSIETCIIPCKIFSPCERKLGEKSGQTRNDSIYSLSVLLLRSRTWMAGLTSAPEGSCSLAKLQIIHEHLCLRSGSHWGCRVSENKRWGVVQGYWDAVSDTVCQVVSQVED